MLGKIVDEKVKVSVAFVSFNEFTIAVQVDLRVTLDKVSVAEVCSESSLRQLCAT